MTRATTRAMTGACSAGVRVLLMLPVALVGGCAGGSPTLPTLLQALPKPAETAPAEKQEGPHESSLMVAGTPTGVFAQVARGALGCWFAADGPLKASHVYRAEAQPPGKGGAAEITIYQRDVSLRDQRGPKAYQVAFTGEAAGVRVVTTAMKFELAQAQAMERDVGSWAKGGAGCQLRALMPPPLPPTAARSPQKTATQKAAPRKTAPQKTAKRPDPDKKQ